MVLKIDHDKMYTIGWVHMSTVLCATDILDN